MMKAVDSNPERTLRAVATEHPDLIEWWNRFEALCPDLAGFARYVRVMEVAEAVKRTGHSDWLGECDAYGADDWVCFTAKPTAAAFIHMLLEAALGLPYRLAEHLRCYFEEGVARQNDDLVEFGRQVVRAAILWCPRDFEERLGEQLWPGDRAKLQWATSHPQHLQSAVSDFLLQCLVGIQYRDPYFTRCAETLFGPIPKSGPREGRRRADGREAVTRARTGSPPHLRAPTTR